MFRTRTTVLLLVAAIGMATKADAANPDRRPINPQTRGAGTGQSRRPTSPQTRSGSGLLSRLITAPLRVLSPFYNGSSAGSYGNSPQAHQFSNQMSGHLRAPPSYRNSMSAGHR